MKPAHFLGALLFAVSAMAVNSASAQNTPTKLTQPVVNAQEPGTNPAQEQRNARFRSVYGSAPPAARTPVVAPAAAPVAPAPVAVAAPAPAATPGQPVPAVAPVTVSPQETQRDARFRSAYGSSMPNRAQAAPAPAAAVAPGVAPAVPVASAPAPVQAARVDPDREQRVINFQRQNAISGNPSAQYDLGMRYLKGDGLEKDLEQARHWLSLAAKAGNGRAKKQLAALPAPSNKPAAGSEAPAAPANSTK